MKIPHRFQASFLGLVVITTCLLILDYFIVKKVFYFQIYLHPMKAPSANRAPALAKKRRSATLPVGSNLRNFLGSSDQTHAPFLSQSDAVKQLPCLRDKYTMKEVDCVPLFNGNQTALEKAYALRRQLRTNKRLDEEFYKREAKNCPNFVKSRGYIFSSLSSDEEDFPLAYSIMLYKDIEMFERLLRAIYRPQNYYCLHVDIKASFKYFQAVEAIMNCFPNIIWAPKWLDVKWGKFSVLEPEIVCMEALWDFRWKYFINLTGQEFPLQTNAQLVRILKAFNGANDAFGSIKNAFPKRWQGLKPPLGIRLTKGQVHIAASRPFVNYILHNTTAQTFLNWTRRTEIPDETFFSSLNHNPQLGIPGSHTGTIDHKDYFSVCRYKNWQRYRKTQPCPGRYSRHICILSTGDLKVLKTRKEMFANKFHLDEDPFVIGCLEEMHFNNTLEDYTGNRIFNASYYANLDFVKNHVHA